MVEKVQERSEASQESIGADNQPDDENTSNVTDFGTTLIAFVLSAFCVFCAWYFAPLENSILAGILNVLFYGLAAFFAVASIALFVNALINAPMVRRFLLMLFGLAGGGRDGWGLFFLGGGFLLIASVLHFLFITVIGLPGVWSYAVEILVIIVMIPAIFWLCLSADVLLFKPFSEVVRTEEEQLYSMVKRVRKSMAITIPILIGIVNLLESLI
jgi:hypothetical protein